MGYLMSNSGITKSQTKHTGITTNKSAAVVTITGNAIQEPRKWGGSWSGKPKGAILPTSPIESLNRDVILQVLSFWWC